MQDFFHQQYFSRICIDRFAGVADVYNYRFHLPPHPGCWIVTTRITIYIFSSGSRTKPSLGVGVDPKYRVHMGVSVPLPFHPPQIFVRLVFSCADFLGGTVGGSSLKEAVNANATWCVGVGRYAWIPVIRSFYM